MPTTYDVFPYVSRPFPGTHPSQLAARAILHGMSPAAVAECRVLELGCASGGNLIPMALGMPGSRFVGVDLSSRQIAAGREMIAQLGLTNIELREADLTRVDETWGKFDYVIAHGIYSWVPANVRDALLRIASRNLTPQGVAYMSYNTNPGGYLRTMFREMMLHHLAGVTDAEERIAKARELARFLDQSADAVFEDLRAGWRAYLAELSHKSSHSLFHDDLEVDWQPVFFHEFMEHAGTHGLQFLAEMDYDDMVDDRLTPKVTSKLNAWCGNERVKREQYRDFVACGSFRRTLLCHSEVKLADKVEPDKVRGLFATTNSGPETMKSGAETNGANGLAKMMSSHPLFGVTARLAEAVPQRMHFEELKENLRMESADALSESLLSLYGLGLVDLAAWRPDLAICAGEKPMASALARLQASHGELMTTLTHESVEPEDKAMYRLVALLDGTRDREALKRELCATAPEGTDSAAIEQGMERNLENAAKLGLLIG